MGTSPLIDNRKDLTGHTITYKTVQLKDDNIWLAENFNYFISEDVCQTYSVDGEYDLSYRKDGLYYEWQALTSDVIPKGWHLPTVEEWTTMVNCYGGFEHACDRLVKGGNSGLNLELAGGTYFKNQSCTQLAMQQLGFYWTGSEGDDKEYAALLQLSGEEKKSKILYLRKEFRFNVRLVKDKA